MQNTFTIASRQFRSYFNGPVAYIVIAVSMLLIGIMFWEPFFLIGRASVRQMFELYGWMLAFGGPAVTMGLIAEERRSGTLELLITMPVRESEVILGKYLGALGLLAVMLLVSVPYPLSISTIGSLDAGPVISGYIGVFLEGAAIIGIGLAASSFTENQLIAFFSSVALGLLLVVGGLLLPLLPLWMVNTAEWLSFGYHVESMARGVIDLRDVVYFVSIAGFALMLAFRALESRRWN